ncbi:MAG: S1 RNA-binding domain-containing protein, partial [Phenylobacterium sp.]|nr:S1 RNA-binding domain-containing protein [Phenylobacterium sp.]
MADDMSLSPSRDDFAALLDESLGGRDFMEGTVVKGLVVGIEKDFAIIDVGLKTEGRVLLKEFGGEDDSKATIAVGDTVEVFLERVENAMGEAVISRDKARREEAWTRLEGVYALNEPVMGSIVGRVKGGFTVDLGGASAFLPGSQVDIRPVRDVGPLMGKDQPFAILKM